VEGPAGAGQLTGSGAAAGPRPGPRLLVVTAVAAERDAVARGLTPDGGDANAGLQHPLPGGLTTLRLPLAAHGTADLLAAGVGPAAVAAGTAIALTTAALAGEPYRLVVSAGIAGGFQPAAPVGSLVVAEAIVAADLGAETPEGFVPVTELGFGTTRHLPPAELSREAAELTGARYGTVLTVSTVTGSAARAAELTDRHPGALAEAMEGFGVAEAAAAHGVPVLEMRGVSNPVGPRDRAAWRIGDALAALADGFRALGPVLDKT
jgi:futalosine hydrolase